MNDFRNRPNLSKRSTIISRPTDEECDVQVGEILDLLAALMRKQNRVKAGDQGGDSEESQDQTFVDSQN